MPVYGNWGDRSGVRGKYQANQGANLVCVFVKNKMKYISKNDISSLFQNDESYNCDEWLNEKLFITPDRLLIGGHDTMFSKYDTIYHVITFKFVKEEGHPSPRSSTTARRESFPPSERLHLCWLTRHALVLVTVMDLIPLPTEMILQLKHRIS